MDRLAIAITDEAMPQGNSLAVPVSAGVGDRLYRARGEVVLTYTVTGDLRPAFIGLAEVSGLMLAGAGEAVRAVMTFTRRFAAPRIVPSLTALPRNPTDMRLSPEVFASILAQDDGEGTSAAAEAAAHFAPPAGELDRIVAIYQDVLEDFGQTCPFTDQVYAKSFGHNPMLNVEPILPLHLQGTLDPANLLIMTRDVQEQWRDGMLTLAPDLSFVFKAGVDQSVMKSLRPQGKLRLPASGTLPDQDSLGFHRSFVCGL